MIGGSVTRGRSEALEPGSCFAESRYGNPPGGVRAVWAEARVRTNSDWVRELRGGGEEQGAGGGGRNSGGVRGLGGGGEEQAAALGAWRPSRVPPARHGLQRSRGHRAH